MFHLRIARDRGKRQSGCQMQLCPSGFHGGSRLDSHWSIEGVRLMTSMSRQENAETLITRRMGWQGRPQSTLQTMRDESRPFAAAIRNIREVLCEADRQEQSPGKAHLQDSTQPERLLSPSSQSATSSIARNSPFRGPLPFPSCLIVPSMASVCTASCHILIHE